jgi:hypothetical protein
VIPHYWILLQDRATSGITKTYKKTMQTNILKIGKSSAISAIAGACLLAALRPAQAETVTWTFHAQVTSLFSFGGPIPPELSDAVPIGTPLDYSLTFDRATPGAPAAAYPAEWVYPLNPGEFHLNVNFGPFEFASTTTTAGQFTVVDDDRPEASTVGNLLEAYVPTVQVTGPNIGGAECTDSASAGVLWAVGSANYSAVNGNAIPLTPYDLSIADLKRISFQIQACENYYFVDSRIISFESTTIVSPCDSIHDLLVRVDGAGLAKGTAQSLTAKINSAAKTLCDDQPENDGQAAGPLGALQNELSAQSGKKIPAALAQSLSADVQAIIDSLHN